MNYILVGIEEVKLWVRSTEPHTDRGDVWRLALKEIETLTKQGKSYECRWFSKQSKTHKRFPSHGAVEVVEVQSVSRAVRVRERSNRKG